MKEIDMKKAEEERLKEIQMMEENKEIDEELSGSSVNTEKD